MFIPIFIPTQIKYYNSFDIERGYQDVLIKALKSKYESDLNNNLITLQEYVDNMDRLYGRN